MSLSDTVANVLSQILLFDQRGILILSDLKALSRGADWLCSKGTGLSNMVTASTLAAGGGPMKQAALLKYFRADSIDRSIYRVLVEFKA